MRKLTVLVDDDLFEDVNKYVPWGLRRHVVSTLLRMAVDVAKKEGQVGLAAVMENSFSLKARFDNGKT